MGEFYQNGARLLLGESIPSGADSVHLMAIAEPEDSGTVKNKLITRQKAK